MKNIEKILNICFWIPIVNIVCDIAMNYLLNLKPQIALARVLFMVGALAMASSYLDFKKSELNKTILGYLVFIFCLSLLSSDLNESILDGFAKMFMSLMMIPLGYFAGQIKRDLVIKPMLIVMILLIINYIFAQIFKTGVSVYDEDSFYTGGASAAAPIILVIGIIILFNSINTKQLKINKILVISIISSSIFVVLLSVKRGAILALIFGILTYIFTSSQKSKSLLFLVIFAGGTAIFVSQYSDVLTSRIEARTTDRNDFENENRFKESEYIVTEFEKEFNIFQIFIGNEAFNSKDCFVKYFGRKRQLHVDYNILLYGTGLIGFIWFLFIYFKLYRRLVYFNRIVSKMSRRANQTKYIETKGNISVCYALIVMSLIMSFSGGLQFVSYRVMLFLAIGAYMGAIRGNLKNKTIKNI